MMQFDLIGCLILISDNNNSYNFGYLNQGLLRKYFLRSPCLNWLASITICKYSVLFYINFITCPIYIFVASKIYTSSWYIVINLIYQSLVLFIPVLYSHLDIHKTMQLYKIIYVLVNGLGHICRHLVKLIFTR